MKKLFFLLLTFLITSIGIAKASDYKYRVWAINCGYAGDEVYAGFVKDTFAIKGSALWDWGVGAISTTGVANAAPAEVYQTCRFEWNGGDMEYVITGLVPNREYLVRLHFGELSSSANARIFNIKINEMPVEVGLDIFVRNNNVASKALVLDYEDMEANAAGELDLLFTDALKDNTIVNGIEIYSKQQEGNSIETTEESNSIFISADKESQELKVSSSVGNIDDLSVFSTQGQLVYKSKSETSELSVSSHVLPKGVYVVKVKSETATSTKKVVL